MGGIARRFFPAMVMMIMAALLVANGGLATATAAEPISSLAPRPDWSELERFQKTITRDDFVRILDSVYAPNGAWKRAIEVGKNAALIRQPGSSKIDFRLEFARSAASARPVPRYWTPARALAAPASKPLTGYVIGLDPGHIGGRWAKTEERWFKIGNSKPVMEGEMALTTARLLAERLKAAGAKVVYVRGENKPVTKQRPDDFKKVAMNELRKGGVKKIRKGYNGANDPLKTRSVDWQSELLFYRVSEIRARARLVNEQLKPDLVICLHYNAEAWGDPARPRLTDKNHLHMLVNGNYSAGELMLEDERYDMLVKLLNRSARVELPLSSRVAASLARATGLPPYVYHDSSRGRRVTQSPYVWGRNLLANRLYHCPVIYCEPYVMNSIPVFKRVQLGDYKGTKVIDGKPRKSIFREYADGVAEGVIGYFGARKGN